MGLPSGEQPEFERWFRELYPGALRVATRVLGPNPDAEDIVAEAFARALLAWRQVRRLAYRDAWLLRVVTNVAIDHLRRRRPQVQAEQLVEGEDDAAVLRVALRAALGGLPRRQREAIALRYLAGLSTAQVAACLDISAESVKEHVARAVAKLRDRLGPTWKEPEVVCD